MRTRGGETLGRGLILALALCAALTFVHAKRQQTHRPDLVIGAVRDDMLLPPQILALNISNWGQIHLQSLWQGPRLARENTALKAQVAALESENKQLRAAQAENNSLRRELGFEKRSPLPLLPGEVAALKPSALTDTLTLNRGTGQGVHLSQVVLGPDGALVGQVVDCAPRSCTVLMLTDAGSAAGAEVVRSGATPGSEATRLGVCRGTHSSLLTLTIPRIDADIRPGDSVVTSNLGTVFPPGLPIGTVISVTTDRTRAVRQALLRPRADFDHLQEAFLVQ
jgi:rod shape-determining protein MreC